jgi:hypothetical protein
MANLSDKQKHFLDRLYEKTVSGSLHWRARSSLPDSYEADVGKFTVNIDFGRKGDEEYELWVFDNLDIVDSLYSSHLGSEDVVANNGFESYKDLIRGLHVLISGKFSQSYLDEITRALDEL